MHCFSMPEQLQECLARGYAISFAGNVTYKSAPELAGAAASVPQEQPAGRDRRALPDAAGGAQAAKPARVRRPHAAFIAELRGVSVEQLGATVERNAARVLGWE